MTHPIGDKALDAAQTIARTALWTFCVLTLLGVKYSLRVWGKAKDRRL